MWQVSETGDDSIFATGARCILLAHPLVSTGAAALNKQQQHAASGTASAV